MYEQNSGAWLGERGNGNYLVKPGSWSRLNYKRDTLNNIVYRRVVRTVA